MTVGINTSPLAGPGRHEAHGPARVEIALEPGLSATSPCASSSTARPDTWEVQGRGALQLAVLVETMWREGFELTVGKPQVVIREVNGKLHEPVELLDGGRSRRILGVVTHFSRCARAAWSRW